jgi:tetratricopeptide (TPR) repeat protein
MLLSFVKNTKKIICLLFFFLLLSTTGINTANAQGFTEAVKTSYITIRREAKFNSVIVAKKMRGDRYRKVFEDKNWLKIEFQDGTTGWIFKTLTNRVQLDRPDTKEEDENLTDKETEATASTKSGGTAYKDEQAKKETDKTKEAALKKTEDKPQTSKTKPVEEKATSAVKPKEAPKPAPVKPSLISDTSLNAEDLYNKAIVLYEKRQFEEALELNLLASKKAPKNAEILNNVGNCLFKLSRVQEALDYWYAALKVAPKSGKICNNIGIALYQLDKSKEAIGYYKKAIEFEPDFADTYYNLASAYGYTGDFANAVHNYKVFLTHSPEEVMHKLAEDRIEYCEKLMQKK